MVGGARFLYADAPWLFGWRWSLRQTVQQRGCAVRVSGPQLINCVTWLHLSDSGGLRFTFTPARQALGLNKCVINQKDTWRLVLSGPTVQHTASIVDFLEENQNRMAGTGDTAMTDIWK